MRRRSAIFPVSLREATRIEALPAQHGATFEAWYGRHTALANYATSIYSSGLARDGSRDPGRPRPRDVGAPTSGMHTRSIGFSSEHIDGVDVEDSGSSHRLQSVRRRSRICRRSSAHVLRGGRLQHTGRTGRRDHRMVSIRDARAGPGLEAPTLFLARRTLSSHRAESGSRRHVFMVNQGREEADIAAGWLPPGWASCSGPVGPSTPLRPKAPSPGGVLVDDLTSYPRHPPALHGPHRTIPHLLTGIVLPSCQREAEALSRSS